MKVFTTLSDSSFLPQGLALLRSLRQAKSPFVLHYLCLDEQIHEIMKHEPNVNAVLLKDLENKDKRLVEAYTSKPSQEAFLVASRTDSDPLWIQHCWRLASYWTHYVLNEYSPDDITYLDADLFFFSSFQNIYAAVGEKSIGLVRNNGDNDAVNGRFNVSLIYFKNDLVGNQALFSWRNWLLDNENEYAKEYGRCGDQKYLELFPELFGEENIQVLDDAGIKQYAPWNLGQVDKEITFFHFSNFEADFDKEQFYIPAARHGLANKTSLDKTPRLLYSVYYDVQKEELERVKRILK
jgi:hypothetical protein